MQTFQTLIAPDALAANMDNPKWIVIDVRHDLADIHAGRRQYTQAHIPGAHFLSVENDLSGPKNGHNGRHPLPAIGDFAATLSAIGVDATKQVIAYDQAPNTYSGRLWWMLRWAGHRNVAVLDGGLDAWIRAGFPVTTTVPQPVPARFEATESELPVSVQTVIRNIEDLEMTVIDARGADRFRGQNETIDPVAGHIPGARNRPYPQNMNSDGTFKDPATLRTEWEAFLGGRAPAEVIHQCGSGITACNNMLAMEIAGLHGSRLYPGSWSEWSADPARPIER
ncbi:MAG: sulfurtransferase [Betaproteobacteria bacterium]